MSHHDAIQNDPRKEVKHAAIFLALFAALVGWIFYGGWFRPAAPSTLAETKRIIGLAEVKAQPAAAQPVPAAAPTNPVSATDSTTAPAATVMADATMATATATAATVTATTAVASAPVVTTDVVPAPAAN